MAQKNTFPDIPREIRIRLDEEVRLFLREIASRSVVIDMGCGHGDYLIDQCEAFPDKLFVGVEISRKRANYTSERLLKRGFTNYYVVHGDGEAVLRLLFPSESVDELHINFPDPWLRMKHWKNRIFQPSFLVEAIRVLKPGATLDFVTDVADYARYVGDIIREFPLLENQYDNVVEKNLFDRFPTLFYQRMSPLRHINYIRFRKG